MKAEVFCEKLGGCPFYNDKMPMDKGLGSIYKKKYCEGNKTNCARYMVAKELGKEHVPITLYPNMQGYAASVIKKVTV